MPSPNIVTRFKGLNTKLDPLEMGLGWLRTADNVDITGDGQIERRDGYTKVMSAVPSGAFSTQDFSRLYLVDGGALKAVNADLSTVTLKAGLSSAPMHWAEHNKQVFFANGVDSGVIRADGVVLDWAWPRPAAVTLAAVTGTLPAGQYQVVCTFLLPDGRETGSGEAAQITLAAGKALQLSGTPIVAGLRTLVYIAPADSQVFGFAFAATGSAAVWNTRPEQLGADLTTLNRYPLPAGATLPTSWNGRIAVALYDVAKDQSTVLLSDPLAPHLFSLESGFFMVPGQVLMLAPTEKALIVGTRSKLLAYTAQAELSGLADYGTVPGHNWTRDGADDVLLWTTRGLCRALPFTNLTEEAVSTAPGLRVGLALIERDGDKRAVATVQSGGAAFNARLLVP